MTKLNKINVEVQVEKKVDNRANNTGRPVNKKSARQVRLAKQAFYSNVNEKFKSGSTFKVSNGEYKYSQPNEHSEYGCIVNNKFVSGKPFQLNGSSSVYKYNAGDNGGLGCIVETAFNTHCANVSYVGRTKVQAYSFTLGKKVNVELNLKTLKFVS